MNGSVTAAVVVYTTADASAIWSTTVDIARFADAFSNVGKSEKQKNAWTNSNAITGLASGINDNTNRSGLKNMHAIKKKEKKTDRPAAAICSDRPAAWRTPV